MSDEVAMDPAGVGEVAGTLDAGATELDAAGVSAAEAPDAGGSTAVVAELMAAMCGAVGVYVEAMGTAAAATALGADDLGRVDAETAAAFGGGR